MIQPLAPVPFPPTPIPNSYWVRPGRLLAGEYPGLPAPAPTLDRIQRLLRAGVTAFVDLTAEGELAPYVQLLPVDGSVTHQRWPIRDHDLPESPQYMQQILDAVDAALAEGRCVYVHCRAGIGRTGTVVGCHLIRSGLGPDAALEYLNQLWLQCARSESWSSVPETDEQYRYVREWREAGPVAHAVAPDPEERREGALIGLVCGDGLGALVAAGRYDLRQLAQTDVPPLQPGFDAATTLCALNSLQERAGHDASDQMQRYLEWSRSAPAAELPADFRRALAAWQWSKKPNAGSHDPADRSAHSLARSLAAALYMHREAGAAIELAADISRTTQQSPIVLDMCRLWAAILVDALSGVEVGELLALRGTPAIVSLQDRRLRPEVRALLDGGWRNVGSNDGDVIAVGVRALRALDTGRDFAAAMQIGLDGAAPLPTVGALTGMIAGACFGITAIPQRWREAVPQLQSLQALARSFA
ncbi:ADP-ribosylglycohydrolase family protein [Povalibacter sp.]|uniref:ADP-ribosylglycohydrolase family protein n=1 Tax=Povalibacter sp. TaxID=1962978 RepID=UPI002F3EA9C5